MPIGRAILVATSLGALALLARSLLQGPVPLLVALVALIAYLTVIVCGVVFLRLGMFVDVVWRGPADARGVALTFDDGPSPIYTPQILDMLDEAQVKASFFVIGHKAQSHPEIIRAIAERGHAIGIHGYVHDRFFSLRSEKFVHQDLKHAQAIIQKITGISPTMFRPPIGHSNPTIARVVKAMNLQVVGWSARSLDGFRRARPDRVAARILPKLRDGAIVLLHDAAEADDYQPATLTVLPRILAAMQANNLVGVRVDAWVDDDL